MEFHTFITRLTRRPVALCKVAGKHTSAERLPAYMLLYISEGTGDKHSSGSRRKQEGGERDALNLINATDCSLRTGGSEKTQEE